MLLPHTQRTVLPSLAARVLRPHLDTGARKLALIQQRAEQSTTSAKGGCAFCGDGGGVTHCGGQVEMSTVRFAAADGTVDTRGDDDAECGAARADGAADEGKTTFYTNPMRSGRGVSTRDSEQDEMFASSVAVSLCTPRACATIDQEQAHS